MSLRLGINEDEEVIDQEDSFTYLGSIISKVCETVKVLMNSQGLGYFFTIEEKFGRVGRSVCEPRLEYSNLAATAVKYGLRMKEKWNFFKECKEEGFKYIGTEEERAYLCWS